MYYKICGLIIKSNIDFPLLPTIKSVNQIDVDVSFLKVDKLKNLDTRTINPHSDPFIKTYKLRDQFIIELRNPDVNFSLLLDGTVVKCEYPEKTQLDFVRTDFLNSIITFILMLKNVITLHSSAISYNDKVLTFIGKSTAGKSTISYNFCKYGNIKHFTDDVLPLRYSVTENKYKAIPSYPIIKLKQSKIPNNITTQSFPGHKDKVQVYTNDLIEYSGETLELGAIVVLDRRGVNTNIHLTKLKKSEAFKKVLINIFGISLFSQEQLIKLNSNVRLLIEHIPVYELTYPTSLEKLPKVFEIIVKDILNKKMMGNEYIK